MEKQRKKEKTEKNLKLDMRTRTQEMIFYHFHKTLHTTKTVTFLQQQINKKRQLSNNIKTFKIVPERNKCPMKWNVHLIS